MTDEQVETLINTVGQDSAQALADHMSNLMQELLKALEVPRDGRVFVIDSLHSVDEGYNE